MTRTMKLPFAVVLPLAGLLILTGCAGSEPVDGNSTWNVIEDVAQDSPAVDENAAAALPGNAGIAGNEAVVGNEGMAGNDAGATEAVAGADVEAVGARQVVTRWAAALERRDWAAASREWRAAVPKDSFARAFPSFAQVDVTVGDGRIEGAAGSLYYRVPVTVRGTGADGEPRAFQGQATLRRANDVPGASDAELSWHVSGVELKAVP